MIATDLIISLPQIHGIISLPQIHGIISLPQIHGIICLPQIHGLKKFATDSGINKFASDSRTKKVATDSRQKANINPSILNLIFPTFLIILISPLSHFLIPDKHQAGVADAGYAEISLRFGKYILGVFLCYQRKEK
jgi:hypothetical protein